MGEGGYISPLSCFRRPEMDAIFEKYTKKYFPDKDWLLFKAQGITESNLDPSAKSVVGAMGIMQIMPKTWVMIRKQLNILNDPWNPEYNIRAGIYYDRKKYDYWSFERPEYDRLCLMFASYNAGTRNIQRAQDLASQKVGRLVVLWEDIAKELIKVTGKSNSKQTISYIKKIFKIYNSF